MLFSILTMRLHEKFYQAHLSLPTGVEKDFIEAGQKAETNRSGKKTEGQAWEIVIPKVLRQHTDLLQAPLII